MWYVVQYSRFTWIKDVKQYTVQMYVQYVEVNLNCTPVPF